MRTLVAMLSLVSASCGQATVAPGLNHSQMRLGKIVQPLVDANVGISGDLYGIRVKGPSGWSLITTPADYRPYASTNEDGHCQIVAVCPNESDPLRRFCHQAGANSVLLSGVPMPRHSLPICMDSTGLLGGPVWSSSHYLFDSLEYDTTASPIILSQTISAGNNAITVDATLTRTSAQIQREFSRWNVPYVALNPDDLISLTYDGQEHHVSTWPLGTDTDLPHLDEMQTPTILIRCKCGRWVWIDADATNETDETFLIRFWRPQSKLGIVTMILQDRPIQAGQSIGLLYGVTVQ